MRRIVLLTVTVIVISGVGCGTFLTSSSDDDGTETPPSSATDDSGNDGGSANDGGSDAVVTELDGALDDTGVVGKDGSPNKDSGGGGGVCAKPGEPCKNDLECCNKLGSCSADNSTTCCVPLHQSCSKTEDCCFNLGCSNMGKCEANL